MKMTFDNLQNLTIKGKMNAVSPLPSNALFYNGVMPKEEIVAIANAINAKTRVLPFSLAMFLNAPNQYIQKQIAIDPLLNVYKIHIPDFFKRITLAKDSISFAENYKPEVSAIRKIASSCFHFLNKQPDQMSFDKGIESILKVFAQTPTPANRKLFIA